jgi:hypothetical protein
MCRCPRKRSTGRRSSIKSTESRRNSVVKAGWRKSGIDTPSNDQNSDSSTTLSPSSPLPILSPLTRKKDNLHEYLSSTVLGSKDWEFVKNLHTLDLTIEELAHIRAQLTKAALEERNVAPDKKRDLEKGRLCFVCENVRFGVFSWASFCIICNKYICSKCVSKIKLPSDNLRDIPVSILTNQLCSSQYPEDEAEFSVLRRLSVQIGIPTTSTPSAKSQPSASSRTSTASRPPLTSRPFASRPLLFRQQTSPDLKHPPPPPSVAQTASRDGFSRTGWSRNSLRNPTLQVPIPNKQPPPSRPKLTRSKTMTKGDVEKLQSLKLGQPGVLHSTCTTCRDLLTCLVRAKLETDNLHSIRGRLTTFHED